MRLHWGRWGHPQRDHRHKADQQVQISARIKLQKEDGEEISLQVDKPGWFLEQSDFWAGICNARSLAWSNRNREGAGVQSGRRRAHGKYTWTKRKYGRGQENQKHRQRPFIFLCPIITFLCSSDPARIPRATTFQFGNISKFLQGQSLKKKQKKKQNKKTMAVTIVHTSLCGVRRKVKACKCLCTVLFTQHGLHKVTQHNRSPKPEE